MLGGFDLLILLLLLHLLQVFTMNAILGDFHPNWY